MNAPRNGRSVNDNNPIPLAGHELSDLNGVPQPQAAESVAHYMRVSKIDSFPVHPRHAPRPDVEALASDVSPDGRMSASRRGRAVGGLAYLGSLLCHAAVIVVLVSIMASSPDFEALEEAGDTVSVIVLGDSDVDQLAAGEESTEPAVPTEIASAETAPPQTEPTVTPPEPTPPEATLPERPAREAKMPDVSQDPPVAQPETPPPPQPVEPPKAQSETPPPAEPAEPPEAVTEASPTPPEPEVLTSSVPSETTVAPPPVASPPVEPPAEHTPVADHPAKDQLATDPPAEVAVEKPAPVITEAPTRSVEAAKPTEKPKKIAKAQPPKKAPPKAGSGGENKMNATKGSLEGTEKATADVNSQSNASRSGSGSAAVANYPGKVQSRIRRFLRVPSEYKHMSAAMTVRVRLAINAGGDVGALSVARSSGIAELDQAVVAGIRAAAPFPPLPPEWGRPSWSFTQEVQVAGF
jgi:protein TonB